MKQGWSTGIQVYVRIRKRYRRGVLKSKIGSKWDFKPDGQNKTVKVCPIQNVWHYNFSEKPITWKKKIKVLMQGEKPFKLHRERIGNWSGAKTCKTTTVPMRVWQVIGTSKVYVGHLGLFKLVKGAKGRKLEQKLEEPTPKESFFIGRGPLDPRKFKCLKLACAPFGKPTTHHTTQLYQIPSREELSTYKKQY